MAMVVQHNLIAMNTNRQLGITTSGIAKSTEKLSSGYRINRAADDAAGLAISEKMRSQIRGLNQASTNAQDGISMIQTAEGALNESHSILQRMRELTIQAANGTETNDDRGNIQDEIAQLQSELDRISETTEFNTMKLLDGSLGGGGSVGDAGPKFGVYDTNLQAFITSDVKGVQVAVTNGATKGGESALWNGNTLTLSLAEGSSYTQSEIDALLKKAQQEDSSATTAMPQVTVNLKGGSISAPTSTTTGVTTDAKGVSTLTSAATVAGKQASGTVTFTGNLGAQTTVKMTSAKYGPDNNIKITFKFDAEAGDEEFKEITPASYTAADGVDTPAEFEFKLATGKSYSAKDLEKLMAEQGFQADVTVITADPNTPSTFLMASKDSTGSINTTLTGGAGLGDTDAFFGEKAYGGSGTGSGVELQIGANYGQTMEFAIGDMSASALGVSGSSVDVSTQTSAQNSIDAIDEAIATVSKQRSLLGAVQNRLEHTIANLDNTAENLQSAESGIRDTDMASEMVQFSKNNILQQAAQSMLAQANQSNQSVLSLLG